MTSAVLVFARLTVLEASRRRLLWVLVLLTVALVGLTAWGIAWLAGLARTETGVTDVLIEYGVSQLLVFAAFMFSFVLAMTAAFLGAPAIAADLESGVALAVLARPVTRADLLIGKWLGLAVVVSGYAVLAGLGEIGAVGLVAGYVPPDPLAAAAFVAGQALVVLAFAALLSTRLAAIAGGAVSVVAFGLAWFAGTLGAIGRLFDLDALRTVSSVARAVFPSDLLWRGAASALMPPPATITEALGRRVTDTANPFAGGQAPGPVEVAWAVAWVVLVLWAAVRSLERREL